MSGSRITHRAVTCVIIGLCLLTSVDILAQNRKGYFPDDWISYTKTRFVTSAALGWNDVYFGTTGGIIRYNSLDRKWDTPITTSDGLATSDIRRIAVRPGNENIWVETPTGIYSYNPVFQEWALETEFPTDIETPQSDYQAKLPRIFIDPGYMFTADGNRAYLTDPQFRRYLITSMVEDDFYHLWVATYGYGVIDVDLRSNFAVFLPFGLYQEKTDAIYIDEETIWFGGRPASGYENGITRWDRSSDKWSYYEAEYHDWIESDIVNDIAGNDEFVFFGTDYGVVQYDKEEETFRSFTPPLGLRSEEIHSLYIEDSLLFMGGEGSIDVLLIPRDSIFPLNAPIPRFAKVYSMSHIAKNVWICTDQGLFRFNERSAKWSRFDVPAGYLDDQVWQALEDTSGDIWFASIEGVVHLDSNLTEIESFLSLHDLGGRTPHRIALADNKLWIGTDNGVMRYNRVNHLWAEYGTEDGLIDNYINDMKLEGDHIWFATPEGVTRYFWNNPLRTRDR